MGSKSGLESCGAIAHKYTYIVDDFCHLKHIPFSLVFTFCRFLTTVNLMLCSIRLVSMGLSFFLFRGTSDKPSLISAFLNECL